MLLLRHIGDGSYHGGDARHAGTKAHSLSNTHLALQLGWDNDFATWLDAGAMTYLCHLTIHVDDVCLALDCI